MAWQKKCWIGALCAALLLTGCAGSAQTQYQEGYYTARMDGCDSYGWEEFIVLYIRDDRIVNVEYNACNVSGFIKSWDMDYMREMNEVDGTYPNEYVRIYAQSLLTRQDPARVDAISGATHSHETFQQLAAAALEQAKTGDTAVAVVPYLDN